AALRHVFLLWQLKQFCLKPMKMISFVRPESRMTLRFNTLVIRISDFFRISNFRIRILALFLLPLSVPAFPPAPYHTIYGLVRNEYGEPLYVTGAQIIFEATNGVQVTGTIVPGLEPGINYRLELPMDSGIAPDNYKPTALKPTLPFLIRVKI